MSRLAVLVAGELVPAGDRHSGDHTQDILERHVVAYARAAKIWSHPAWVCTVKYTAKYTVKHRTQRPSLPPIKQQQGVAPTKRPLLRLPTGTIASPLPLSSHPQVLPKGSHGSGLWRACCALHAAVLEGGAP